MGDAPEQSHALTLAILTGPSSVRFSTFLGGFKVKMDISGPILLGDLLVYFRGVFRIIFLKTHRQDVG